ncbi:hypothetical protein DID97_15150 [Burkholderia sp. Bp8977]|nr:hypothetical protein DIE10_14755 [Burkholderia sp. Bp9011]RQR92000.1 hypothetical protein DIE09_16980 [Burkholderia sp. Bp9010]RQS76487.1 hypothetical protein DID97_15150 [Burkholderia sp. Bp8977]
MLRRVVKDHSDIKKSLMVRTAVSVWYLKEKRLFELDTLRESFFLKCRPFCVDLVALGEYWNRAQRPFKSTGFFFHFNYSNPIRANR